MSLVCPNPHVSALLLYYISINTDTQFFLSRYIRPQGKNIRQLIIHNGDIVHCKLEVRWHHMILPSAHDMTEQESCFPLRRSSSNRQMQVLMQYHAILENDLQQMVRSLPIEWCRLSLPAGQIGPTRWEFV